MFHAIAQPSSTTDLDLLKIELSAFLYSRNGTWNNFPSIIEVMSTSGIIGRYKVDNVTYNITAIDISTKEVTVNNLASGSSEIHKIIGDQYGKVLNGTIKDGTEIAIKKDATAIQNFAQRITALNLTRKVPPSGEASLFSIADDGKYQHQTGGTYEIGRVIDNNTVLIAFKNDSTTGTEINGLRDGKYGTIKTDGTIDDIIAEYRGEVLDDGVIANTRNAQNLSLAFNSSSAPYLAYIKSEQPSVIRVNGSAWEYVGTPEFASDVTDVSLAVNGTTPHIAFVANNKLKVQKNTGSSWVNLSAEAPTSVDVADISLAFWDAHPMVAFQNEAERGKMNARWNNTVTPGKPWENARGKQNISSGKASAISLAFKYTHFPYISSKSTSGEVYVMMLDKGQNDGSSEWIKAGDRV